MPAAVIYVVRHGETEENRMGVMQGQLDTSLNAMGVEQARLTANALEKVPFARAHSSDLTRAIKVGDFQAAEIIITIGQGGHDSDRGLSHRRQKRF